MFAKKGLGVSGINRTIKDSRNSRLKRQAPTLREALNKYVTEISSKKRGGYSDKSLQKTWNNTSISDKTISTITQRDLVHYRDKWLNEVAPATVIRRLALVSHLYTIAIKDWGLTYIQDPSKLLRRPIVRNERSRRLYSDIKIYGVSADIAPTNEIDWVVRNTRSKTLPIVVLLAVETAMRRSEIVNIKREDINFQSGYIHVPVTKNGRPRKVPLSPWAKYSLIDYIVENNHRGYVFRSTSPEGTTRAFARALERSREKYEELCKQNEVEPRPELFKDLRFHDLRHEASSRLAEVFEMHELAKITGHADTRMLLRYYHPDPQQLSNKLANSKIGQQQFANINNALLSRL